MRKKIVFMTALLCIVLLPVTSWAAVVEIGEGDEVPAVRANIQNAINNLQSAGGGTVTVTGGKGDADRTLILIIPENVTVEWKAGYSGRIGGEGLIFLSGAGTFEVAEGGAVSSIIGPDGKTGAVGAISSAISVVYGNVKITGGTVKASVEGGDIAMAVAINVNNGTVTAADGTIKAESGIAAFAIAAGGTSEIAVTGGAVEAAGGLAAAINGAEDDVTMVTVADGAVKAEGEAAIAVVLGNGVVTVTNGSILAVAGGIPSIVTTAVEISNTGVITVDGGSVKAESYNEKAVAIGLGSGAVKVTGGRVEAAGGGADPVSVAISISGELGLAAYLESACSGKFEIKPRPGGLSKDSAGLPGKLQKLHELPELTQLVSRWADNAVNEEGAGGVIAKVDLLDIPRSRHGGNEGLEIMAMAGGESVVWNTEGNVTEIVFTMKDDEGTIEIPLGWDPK